MENETQSEPPVFQMNGHFVLLQGIFHLKISEINQGLTSQQKGPLRFRSLWNPCMCKYFLFQFVYVVVSNAKSCRAEMHVQLKYIKEMNLNWENHNFSNC